MLVNKLLSKSLRPLLSVRTTRRCFFSNEKPAPESTNNATEQTQNVQETMKESPVIKLTDFTEEELKHTRIPYKTIIKSIEPYRQHNQKAYDRLYSEIENLYKDKDAIPGLRMEIKSLDDVNKVNHEKLVKAVDRIKGAEQEALDIESRLSKEIEKSKTYAISKFSSEVLEILDNLELCMENVNKNKEKNKQIIESDFYEGVNMTYNHALNLFKRFGVTQIEEGVGHKMDPNVHDVLFIAKDTTKPEGEIIHVAKRGYKLGDRVLRASKVGVVRND